MTPQTSSVEEFGRLLVRSRLFEGPDVQTLVRRWRREAFSESDDVDQFSQWLVAQEAVTEYQVKLLLRGHADHCFVGDYKLLNRIGKGRMAGVYQALDKQGQLVALKVLPPSRVLNPQSLARFHREAKLALRLNHPNVVRTFHFAGTQELVYIVMEYLEGETLQDMLQRRGKLTPGESARLVHQALLGLQHLHEKHLVHRDLKPSNLMLVSGHNRRTSDTAIRSTVKILDIGLGKDLLDDTGDDVNLGVQLTGENVLLGTPDYLAPEQARNARGVDIRADLYSLGCVFYHALAGQPPFSETNVFQLVLRHATEKPRPVRELAPSVPAGLQGVLDKMLAKDPAQRFESPARAAEALRPFLPAPESADLAGKGNEAPTAAAKRRRPAAPRPDSDFELAGAAPRAAAEFGGREPPAASIPTTIVKLSANETALMSDEQVLLEPELARNRRDYRLLAGGTAIGAFLVLAVEAVLWLLLRGR